MLEAKTNTTETVISVCNTKLGVEITPGNINYCHRIGQITDDSYRKSQSIIVTFMSYEMGNAAYSAKRKLKGTKPLISDNHA